MRELLMGIIDFRKRIRPNFLSFFNKIAAKQSPDALFVACSDSRVVPNLFASTNPGNLFVVRNVGNMCPACSETEEHGSDTSLAAAIEFSITNLKVQNIIVCGHSECGAMKAVVEGATRATKPSSTPHLHKWLKHAEKSLEKFEKCQNEGYQCRFDRNDEEIVATFDPKLPNYDILSQINVLQQLEHIAQYELVKSKLQEGELLLHGWWFDIANADVYNYSLKQGQFTLIDEEKAKSVIELITQRNPQLQNEPTTFSLDDIESMASHPPHPHWIDPYIFTQNEKNNNQSSEK